MSSAEATYAIVNELRDIVDELKMLRKLLEEKGIAVYKVP